MPIQDHPRHLSEWIKSRAAELGFDTCGISRAVKLEAETDYLEEWLGLGFHGEMSWMERNSDKRTDPRLLLEGARSVISVLLNYYPQEHLPAVNNYKIARYAYGRDYHEIIREKLNELIEDLRLKVGSVGQLDSFQLDKAYGNFRAFVDSAPVLDKAWAERAGLGWMGKNTCLIHPKIGSFVFIGEIITDLELEYDTSRVNDLCGGCNKCIEACPTDAIIAPYRLDARKCISYLTIEYKGELPVDEKPKFGDWIFGCDICQEVCPWNRSVKPGTVEAFKASDELKEMDKDRWGALSGEDFERLFRNSAVKRTRFEGLKRNIMFLTGGRGK